MKLWPVSAASSAAAVATVVALAGNSLIAPVNASSVNFASARLHRIARRKQGVDADLEGWTDQEDVDQNKEELLAERDDLKAQLATKNKEFLEQHRRADHLSRQVRMLEDRLHSERQREKAEEVQLKKARQALDRIGGEAIVAAKEALAPPAVASKPVKRHGAAAEGKPAGPAADVVEAVNASDSATSMLRTRRLHLASSPATAKAAAASATAAAARAPKGADTAAAAGASFDVAAALASVAPMVSNKVAPRAAEADVDEQTEQQEDDDAVSTDAGAAAIGKLFSDKDIAQQQDQQQDPEQQNQRQTPQAGNLGSKVFADIEAQLNKEDARIDGYSFWSEDGAEKIQKPLLQRQQR